MVYSPDQLKPGNPKAARIGAVLSIIFLLLMLFGNHRGHIENYFLIGTAAVLAGILIGDVVLRKNGLRR